MPNRFKEFSRRPASAGVPALAPVFSSRKVLPWYGAKPVPDYLRTNAYGSRCIGYTNLLVILFRI